jgi:hypothetical protein
MDWQSSLISVAGFIATCRSELGEHGAALELATEAAERAQRYLTAFPTNPGPMLTVTYAENRAGRILVAMDRPAEALRHFTETVRVRRLLHQRDPGSAAMSFFLSQSLGERAGTRRLARQFPQALPDYEEMVDFTAANLMREESDGYEHAVLDQALSDLAVAAASVGRLGRGLEALAERERWMARWEGLGDGVEMWGFARAETLLLRARFLAAAGAAPEFEAANVAYREFLAEHRGYFEEQGAWEILASEAELNAAWAAVAGDDWAGAGEAAERALALLEPLGRDGAPGESVAMRLATAEALAALSREATGASGEDAFGRAAGWLADPQSIEGRAWLVAVESRRGLGDAGVREWLATGYRDWRWLALAGIAAGEEEAIVGEQPTAGD